MKYLQVLSFACVSTILLASCGKNYSRMNQNESLDWQKKAEANPTGTWRKKCDPGLHNGRGEDRSFRFENGRYYEETTSYKAGCKDIEFAFKIEGTYKVEGPSKSAKDFSYSENNVVLNDAGDAYDLDIEISLYRVIHEDIPKDLDMFRKACASARYDEITRELEIDPKNCDFEGFAENKFTVYRTDGNTINFGFYLGNMEEFNPKGGSTRELRGNVLFPARHPDVLTRTEVLPSPK